MCGVIPKVFNEIGLKMLGKVSRFHVCEYFKEKIIEYREIFKRKFQNIKTMDGNLLLNTSFVFNEIGLKMFGNVYKFQMYKYFPAKFTEYRENIKG